VPERSLTGVWLGKRRYSEVLALQERLVRARGAGLVGDTVLLLEHEPVITLGRGSHVENILASEAELAKLGVEVVAIGRGGDVTLHAPGQLVAYPIFDLKPDRCDVRRYVNDLAEVMRRLAAEHGVASGLVPGMVGVWADAAHPGTWSGSENAEALAKIGAIGVKISRWVTMHGFALNLTTKLAWFGLIVPCGIRDYPVASVEMLTGAQPQLSDAAGRAYTYFGEVFGSRNTPLLHFAHGDLDELVESLSDARSACHA
jgi:lipoyl(octanoyl) transferase